MEKQNDKLPNSKLQNTLFAAIIATEASHVFCCVLPTIFSVLSLLAGLGVVGVVPVWLEETHAAMHNWELPIIAMSGVVVAFGWGLHYYSNKIDCHDHGCGHGPCSSKKKTANRILTIATILFFINVAIFAVFHKGLNIYTPQMIEEAHEAH